MIAQVFRGLCAVALLGIAAAAGAGQFNFPINFVGCGNLDVVGAQMADPNGFFAGAKSVGDCLKLCKITTSACRRMVKGIASCYDALSVTQKAVEEKDCAADAASTPAQVKACRQSLPGQLRLELAINASFRSDSLANCQAWGQTCQDTCQ
jgi:hypothetical protein